MYDSWKNKIIFIEKKNNLAGGFLLPTALIYNEKKKKLNLEYNIVSKLMIDFLK